MELASGYYPVDKYQMSPQEIVDVRKASGWGSMDVAAVERERHRALAVVGAREQASGSLVGVGDIFEVEPQTVLDKRRYAYLGFVGVRPDHRRKGLGEAILLERVRIADDTGIDVITGIVLKSSPMIHVFPRLGFEIVEFESDLLVKREVNTS